MRARDVERRVIRGRCSQEADSQVRHQGKGKGGAGAGVGGEHKSFIFFTYIVGNFGGNVKGGFFFPPENLLVK